MVDQDLCDSMADVLFRFLDGSMDSMQHFYHSELKKADLTIQYHKGQTEKLEAKSEQVAEEMETLRGEKEALKKELLKTRKQFEIDS